MHVPVPYVTSSLNRIESLLFLGPKIWDMVNVVTTLRAFKSGIKKCWLQNLPHKLSKRYLPNIGFV